jgi:hypothetical protein
MSSFGKKKKVAAALAVSAAVFGLVVGTESAHADSAPQGSDVVGVGSDTLQYILDFGVDGDPSGDAGYNAGKLSRVYNFDATADANARAAYGNGGLAGSGLNGTAFDPTTVLRAGQSPRYRPNGSGDGFNEMVNDTGSTQYIQYFRSSSGISNANVTAAVAATNVGHLHVVRLAKDPLGMVNSSVSTNAVALTPEQLFHVYQCDAGYRYWDDAGIGGTVHERIVPIVPQLGSGTRKSFLTDIGFTVDSTNTPNGKSGASWLTNATYSGLGNCVMTGEENDPLAVSNATAAQLTAVNSVHPGTYNLAAGGDFGASAATDAEVVKNAVEPMSGGRLALWTSGYFRNPASKTTLGASINPGVAVTAGTPAQDNASAGATTDWTAQGSTVTTVPYLDNRGLYVVFREASLADAPGFNGGTKNWARTLFANPSTTANGADDAAGFTTAGTAFFGSGAGATLITAAGLTPNYKDCGEDATTDGGLKACVN